MTADDKSIEATWKHGTADIPERGLDVSRRADPAELEAAARYLEIPTVERLGVSYSVKPSAGGTYALEGELRAAVVQTCGITLDPVHTDIRERFEVEFREAGDMPESGSHEQEALEALEYEAIENQQLPVGRIILDTLLAALPPFPRAEGAALDRHEARPEGGGTAGPFADLAKWKPKPT